MATLNFVRMEIDDDDRDVIEALVEVTNQATIPVGQLEAVIKTSDGNTIQPADPITSIGPGLTRSYLFNFSLPSGEWFFKLEHDSASGRNTLGLGPYRSEFILEKKVTQQQPKTSMGEGLFSGAFNSGVGDFGSVNERELIDTRTIELVDYEAEHEIGGSTRINVMERETAQELSDPGVMTETSHSTSPILDDLTATKTDGSLNNISKDVESNAPTGPPSPPAALAGPPDPPPSSAPLGPPDAPPSTPVAGSPDASPPAGPPDSPPSAPLGPPSTPLGPPDAQPSTPLAPTGPPAPAIAPEGPPMPQLAVPLGPPDTPPSAPFSPPVGPPESPYSMPLAAPEGPPESPYSMPLAAPKGPPAGPPSGPPSEPPSEPPSGPPNEQPMAQIAGQEPTGSSGEPPAGPPSGHSATP